MRLFQVLEAGCVWDVAAFFWFAVAFAVGVAGAGGDLAGAGSFLDDVVDHAIIPISVVSARPLFWFGAPRMRLSYRGYGRCGYWSDICFLVLDVAPCW